MYRARKTHHTVRSKWLRHARRKRGADAAKMFSPFDEDFRFEKSVQFSSRPSLVPLVLLKFSDQWLVHTS